ncbi:hypothetical protein [Pseudomonas sp. EA_105y_Pfl2_R69]|uniref:hypothetical protein n=1 Tax=Pseudomonas sp. EA_105y_Pfl2_R69 TaxID=3088683 RepID=UPI0030DBF4B2
MEAEQVINLVEILAWPITVLAILSALRAPLLKLIARINAVEAGGVRAEFGIEIFEMRQVVEDNGNINELKVCDSKGSQLQRLAELSPNGAVVDAWREVELATISAALHNNLEVRGAKGRVSGNAAVRKMREQGLIPQSTYEYYIKLKDLRNKAAHSSETIESSDAKEYSLVALDLASKFREIRSKPS